MAVVEWQAVVYCPDLALEVLKDCLRNRRCEADGLWRFTIYQVLKGEHCNGTLSGSDECLMSR